MVWAESSMVQLINNWVDHRVLGSVVRKDKRTGKWTRITMGQSSSCVELDNGYILYENTTELWLYF